MSDTTESNPEPKPCGRCGHLPVLLKPSPGQYQIACLRHRSNERPQTDPHHTRERAIAAWNEECV